MATDAGAAWHSLTGRATECHGRRVIRLLGMFAATMFALAGVPPAWAVWKAKAQPYAALTRTAAMILAGCLTMYGYLLACYGFDWILAANYAVETVSWGVVLWYSLRSPA